MNQTTLQNLKSQYNEYAAIVQKLRSASPLSEGLLGFGGSMKNDRCHNEFAENVKQIIEKSVSCDMDQETAEAIMTYMYEKPHEMEKDPVVQVMMVAVQQFGEPLLAFVSKEFASSLGDKYTSEFPPASRMPAQKKFIAAILKKAEKKEKKKGILSFFSHS